MTGPRKAKAVVTKAPPKPKEREYHCTSCRKNYKLGAMKMIGLGEPGRVSVFCPVCEVFLKVDNIPIEEEEE